MRILAICVILALACTPVVAADAVSYDNLHPPVELRAIWIDADTIPKTTSEVTAMVREYHRLNFNVLLPEVICRGCAIYPSKLTDRDSRFAHAPDPLAPMIAEAHRLGMEVHPWVWVFRVGYTGHKGPILAGHPDWAECNKNGDQLSINGGYWISPAIPEAREFIANLLAELVGRSDVDGLNLDYIRYEVQSPVPFGYCEAARARFKLEYGIDPMDIESLSPQQVEWEQFRERQVNTFVHRIALQTRSLRPNAVMSASVGLDPVESRLNLMQNWVNWVENKWVDFLVPMNHTTDNSGFAGLVSDQLGAVQAKTILVPGIGMYAHKNPVSETLRQIGITREMRTAGQSLFAAYALGPAQKTCLLEGPYARPASVPFRDPARKSLLMRDEAAKNEKSGAARYYTDCANRLVAYAEYRDAHTPYITPKQPPINIPRSVIPLPTTVILPAGDPITLDGSLTDKAWRSAATVDLRYTIDGNVASEPTQALLLRDDRNIYIAFKCHEPHIDKMKATAAKHDDPTFNDDSVEVFIQPAGKLGVYFHFSTNTIGTQFEQRNLDPTWNGGWTAKTNVGKDEWTAEIAIPLASLGVTGSSRRPGVEDQSRPQPHRRGQGGALCVGGSLRKSSHTGAFRKRGHYEVTMVVTGLEEMLSNYASELRGARVGVVANHASVTRDPDSYL